MRIAAGRFKGRRLKSPKGLKTRPTAGRTKEALFDLLGGVAGLRVADLFAGSGALGLEALSRGAAGLVSVEVDRGAISAIKSNAEALGLAEEITVVRRNLSRGFGFLAEWAPLDLILADPPYDRGWLKRLLAGLRSDILTEGGRVAVESSPGEAPAEPEGWTVIKQRRYGDSVITILTPEAR